MNPREALEAYLLDTRQIDALAKRQAELLGQRGVADKNLVEEARIVLLLNLAALARGATRPPKRFLAEPLRDDVVGDHIDAYRAEHKNGEPRWAAALRDAETTARISAIVDAAADDPLRLGPLTGKEPAGAEAWPLLVVDAGEGRLGFARYWREAARLENRLRAILREPAAASSLVTDEAAAAIVREVFEPDAVLDAGGRFHFRQAAAAALALRARFLVVSGGPGTGKTSVVIQVLRCLSRAIDGLEPDGIVLCAPTGRAKARLGESVDRGIERLAATPGPRRARDVVLKNLGRATVHGLLGFRPGGDARFDGANPLPHRVIVVDEASMVDTCLFSRLIDAAAPDCRIILLGDMHQLPSVEAGAVLGDLTERFSGTKGFPTLTRETAEWVHGITSGVSLDGRDDGSFVLPDARAAETAPPLADHAVILTKSFRLSPRLLELGALVNAGDGEGAIRFIRDADDSGAIELDPGPGTARISLWLDRHFGPEKLARLAALRGMDLDSPKGAPLLEQALALFEESRILVLGHEGGRGRFEINALAEKMLRKHLDDGASRGFFHGQPLVLSANLYGLDLYNGDTCVAVRAKDGALKAVFRKGGGCKIHSIDRLWGLEPAYAVTVHKAQGSEFDDVLLVLPENKSPLLTRQIIYTAITRAKKNATVLGSEEMLRLAIGTREERPGGIRLV